ncbi:hypothetical protein [Neisseria sicca]|uniref:hypothetical protein n=1 Tax=Neisseria sicca TaxID=490 RepID=UPI0011BD1827|nr:hypothetical protein [Neisseria sicca]
MLTFCAYLRRLSSLTANGKRSSENVFQTTFSCEPIYSACSFNTASINSCAPSSASFLATARPSASA